MVRDLQGAFSKTLTELVAAIDSSAPGDEDIALMRQRYDRAVQKQGRAKIGEALGLQVGEVDSLSRVFRRAADAVVSADQHAADGQIAILRFLLLAERISQAKPDAISAPVLPAEADEVFARKQLRALELVVRALINEQYRKQDLLIQRLEVLFKTEVVEKWRKIADPDDVLSGTLLSELGGIFTHKEEFPKYLPIYDSTSALTFMADRRQTIRTFLEDIRDLRNRVAHHKALTAIQVNLLDLYYEQIVKPVQDLCDRGGTKVNPESILDADASTLNHYFNRLQDDLRSIDDRTSDIARDVTQIRKGVDVIQGETKGLHKRTKLILSSACAAVLLAAVGIWQLGSLGHKTENISTQVTEAKKEVSKDPRKELANMGIQWKSEDFLEAIKQGDHKAVTLFLEGGMSPYAKTNLHVFWHIIVNKLPDFDWLLEQFIAHGFDVNKKINDVEAGGFYVDKLPLTVAVRLKNKEAIIPLVKHGADIDLALKELNEDYKHTPSFDMLKETIADGIKRLKDIQSRQGLSKSKDEKAEIKEILINKPPPVDASSKASITDQDKLFSIIKQYFDYVKQKNIGALVSLYTSAKQPKINRQLLERVANDTEYYRIEKISTLDAGADYASIMVNVYHKKNKQSEELWDIKFGLAKENGNWKIADTTGKKAN